MAIITVQRAVGRRYCAKLPNKGVDCSAVDGVNFGIISTYWMPSVQDLRFRAKYAPVSEKVFS